MEKKSKKTAGNDSSHLKKPASFRLTAEADEILEKLSARDGVSKTAIVEIALRRLYRSTTNGGKEK